MIIIEHLVCSYSPNPYPVNCVCVCVYPNMPRGGEAVYTLVCVKCKDIFFTFLHLFIQDMFIVRGHILNRR